MRVDKSAESTYQYLTEKFFVLWWGALRGAVGVVLIIILMDEQELCAVMSCVNMSEFDSSLLDFTKRD